MRLHYRLYRSHEKGGASKGCGMEYGGGLAGKLRGVRIA